MFACRVTNCDRPAEAIFVYNRAPRLEAVVCNEHHRELSEGEPYRVDTETGAIMTGVEIDLAGLRMLTKWLGTSGDTGPGVTLRFEDETGVVQRLYIEKSELERFVVTYATLFVSPARAQDIRTQQDWHDE